MARPLDDPIVATVVGYFRELDRSVDTLSHKNEGNLTGLPPWVLTTKHVIVADISRQNSLIVKVLPEEGLEEDTVETAEISTDNELQQFLAPFSTSMRIGSFAHISMAFGDTYVIRADGINNVPVQGTRSRSLVWVSAC